MWPQTHNYFAVSVSHPTYQSDQLGSTNSPGMTILEVVMNTRHVLHLILLDLFHSSDNNINSKRVGLLPQLALPLQLLPPKGMKAARKNADVSAGTFSPWDGNKSRC